jgi:hypothetical protein
MLRRFRGAYYWLKAQRLWLRNEVEEALHCLHRLETLGDMPPYAMATKAVLLMQLGRSEAADEVLDQVARDTDNSSNPNTAYINLFVRAIRAAVDDKPVLEQHLLREAKRSRCSPTLKRWLPLAEPS